MTTKITIKLKPHKLLSYIPNHNNFDELANLLLNQVLFKCHDKLYRLCEIEFYYCGDEHHDTYTHCSEEQRMKGKFYFHKYKTGTYKSGTYKGLDLTLSPNNLDYFGVLIRSIQDQETLKIVEGPCCSVNCLLSQFGYDRVEQLLKDKIVPLDIYDTTSQFHLIDVNHLTKERIYKGPRIGLSDKYPLFKDLPYRYAIQVAQIKKKRKTLKPIDQTDVFI